MITSKTSGSKVLPQSKKIAKLRTPFDERPTNDEYLVLDTGYDTFLPEEKENILHYLKEQIMALKGLNELDINEKSLSWVQLMKELGAKPVNNLLKRIIPNYRPKLTLSTKELTNLRKKIKCWFKSEGAMETRGDPLIHKNQLESFKLILKKEMKIQQFDQLRRDVLPFIKELREQSDRKFDQGMFSKKYWTNFLKKEENEDIKALWESLPLTNDDIVSTSSSKKDKGFSKLHKKRETKNLEEIENLSKELLHDEIKKNFLDEEEKNSIDTAEAYDFVEEFHDHDWEVPIEELLFNMDDILNEPLTCSPERSDNDFLKSFWNEWNGRSLFPGDLHLTHDAYNFLR